MILHALKEKKAALTMSLLSTATPFTHRRRRSEGVTVSRTEDLYQVLQRLAEGYSRYEQCYEARLGRGDY